MAIIQASRPPGSGGGGGGIVINGYQPDEHIQTTNFTPSSVVITLSQTPVSIGGIIANYNGDQIYPGDDFTLTGNQVTILFGDPYVTDYDTPPVFRFQYPY